MRSYTVRGVTYHPLTSGKGFSERGEASWYGQKFHGHLTANGEIYNMYEMSAAHKTLPLPSFARITNLANGKQVVVRVNDRGPFHINRIVDLSYAAAAKLDILTTGVGEVKLDVIHVAQSGQVTVGQQPTIQSIGQRQPPESSARYIQVVASSNHPQIQRIASKLEEQFKLPTQTITSGSLHRLRLGPLAKGENIQALLQKLSQIGYPDGFVVQAE
jgi:rare lipoprotein A